MIYELRTYNCVPGRMPEVLSRFPDHAMPLWRDLGIEFVGCWTTLVGESSQQVIYLLAWDSLADREQKWSAFMNHPAWVAARAETEANGPLVMFSTNQLLRPSSFSTLQ